MADPLAELTRVRTIEDEQQIQLSIFQDPDIGFPVSDWVVGGVARTMSRVVAAGHADQSSMIATITAGGFPALAAALKTSSGAEVTAWLDLLARYFYALERAGATFTRQRITLSCSAGAGPQTVSAGFIVRAQSGRRYLYNGAPVLVPDAGSATVDVDAENPGARYNDAAGTITEIVTPLPGLTAINAPEKFGGLDTSSRAQRSAGNRGTGYVTPSATGTPAQARQYTISVRGSGAVGVNGVVEIAYLQGGARSVVSLSPIPASYAGFGDGVTMTFTDGAGVGWVAGDVHTFGTPGTPILLQGVDAETNAKLLRRCLGRWPSLGQNIVADKYRTWIDTCSKDNGFGIEKVAVRASATIAGMTEIIVATASGPPSGGVISGLQDYVNARDGSTDAADVFGASAANIYITGSVVVPNDRIAEVKAAADAKWSAYIAALPIGGDLATGYPGVVRLAALEQALMDAGAVDCQVNFFDVLLTPPLFRRYGSNLAIGGIDEAIVPAGAEPSNALFWTPVA